MNERNSPAGEGEAVEYLAGRLDYTESTEHTPRARISAPVLEIMISSSDTARKTIAGATADAEPGTHIRLHVGHTLPPLWLSSVIRSDLVYQVVARDARSLGLWQFELEFGGGR